MTISTYSITEPTRSTMFLNFLTIIDHAYIDDTGCIVGGSFNPSFEISGTPDPIEKVVVDFSAIKHTLKELIDHHDFDTINNGFDHKVWIIEGYSKVTMMSPLGTGGDSSTVIVTPHLTLELPTDAVKYIPLVVGVGRGYTDPGPYTRYIGLAITDYLQPRLEALYPNVNIKVECQNSTEKHLPRSTNSATARSFSYVHGLKDSTSYGCNNIAHGHGSFITALHDSLDHDPAQTLIALIAADLDNTVFVRSDNIRDDADPQLNLEYTTDRGTFKMSIDTEAHKVVVLNTETTVEYLAAYVKHKYGGLMRASGIHTFYISEGLSKGAVETL